LLTEGIKIILNYIKEKIYYNIYNKKGLKVSKKKHYNETEEYNWKVIQKEENGEIIIQANLIYEVEKEYNEYNNSDWNGYSIIDGEMTSVNIITNNTSLTDEELKILIELQVEKKIKDDEYLQTRHGDRKIEYIDYKEDEMIYNQSILFNIRKILNESLKEIMKQENKDFKRKQLFNNIEDKYIENLAKTNKLVPETLEKMLNIYLTEKSNESSLEIKTFKDFLIAQNTVNNKVEKLKQERKEQKQKNTGSFYKKN